MAPTEKSQERGSVTGNDKLEAEGFAREAAAEASMWRDTDSILSRLEDGIARESKAMDDLLKRLRQRAA